MAEVVTGVAGMTVIVAVLVGLFFVGRWLRRTRTVGPSIAAAVAAYNEGMQPTAYDSFVEVRAQDDRTEEVGTPSDR